MNGGSVMGNYLYAFDPDQAYQLTKVTNADGLAKTSRLDFYNYYMGCRAVRLHFDAQPTYENKHRFWMHFVQDENGNWIQRNLHTSIVYKIIETDVELEVHTHNSIYHLVKTELKETEYQDEAELIELYLSMDDEDNFCKGFYYDSDKRVYELLPCIHVGMFADTALIGIKEDNGSMTGLCRYYIEPDKVEFYDTACNQQGNRIPMLIHNNGSENLKISFQFMDLTWTIKSGESRKIIPYRPEGSDNPNGKRQDG